MTGATQARCGDASRGEDIRLVEPTIEDLTISGCHPLSSISTDPDLVLEQAHALTVLLGMAMKDSAAIGPDGIPDGRGFTHESAIFNVNMNVLADAVDGIGTLIAMGLHGVQSARVRAINFRSCRGGA